MVRSRTVIHRHPERARQVPDDDDAEAILARALVAHAGLVDDGCPVVIPMTSLYQDGSIYLHGAPGSRLVKALATGNPVCVETMLVEIWIESMSAKGRSGGPRGAFDDDPDTPGNAGVHPKTTGV